MLNRIRDDRADMASSFREYFGASVAHWEFDGAGAGTHALVVGVGAYRHMPGGVGPIATANEGMGQLTSAPLSAREFAKWLATDFRHRTHPLRSLSLLVSD